jgi:hypothetical protein
MHMCYRHHVRKYWYYDLNHQHPHPNGKNFANSLLVLTHTSSIASSPWGVSCSLIFVWGDTEDGTRCAVLDYQENHGTLLYVVPPLTPQQIAASGLTESFLVDNLSCHRPAPDMLWAIACMTKEAYDIANRPDSVVMAPPSSISPSIDPYQQSLPPQQQAPFGAGGFGHVDPYYQQQSPLPHQQQHPHYLPPPPLYQQGQQQWGGAPQQHYPIPPQHLPPPPPLNNVPFDPRLQHLPPPPPLPPSDPRRPQQQQFPPPPIVDPRLPAASGTAATVLPGLDTERVSETLNYLESLLASTSAPPVNPNAPIDPRARRL